MSLPDYSTQLPGRRQVIALTTEDIHWSYDDSAKPTVSCHKFFGTKRDYQKSVHPAPGYGHDMKLVEHLLEMCHEAAPLCNPVTVNVMHMIDARQVNGWASQSWDYYNCFTPDDCQCDVEGRGKRNWDGVIALSGRATEIHPAIARYVVAHEYGHIAEDALGLIRHAGNGKSSDPGADLVKEWAKVRRIPEKCFDLSCSTTTHHLIPGEVFANDFRFWLGFETEWWPHGDVVPALGERGTKRAQTWWVDALDQLQDCYREAKKAEAA